MWMPTHVQVTGKEGNAMIKYFIPGSCSLFYILLLFLVQKADGLLLKGKSNTNDCFVTIALGKIKYQTSVKEKSGPQVEWHEECEL